MAIHHIALSTASKWWQSQVADNTAARPGAKHPTYAVHLLIVTFHSLSADALDLPWNKKSLMSNGS